MVVLAQGAAYMQYSVNVRDCRSFFLDLHIFCSSQNGLFNISEMPGVMLWHRLAQAIVPFPCASLNTLPLGPSGLNHSPSQLIHPLIDFSY